MNALNCSTEKFTKFELQQYSSKAAKCVFNHILCFTLFLGHITKCLMISSFGKMDLFFIVVIATLFLICIAYPQSETTIEDDNVTSSLSDDKPTTIYQEKGTETTVKEIVNTTDNPIVSCTTVIQNSNTTTIENNDNNQSRRSALNDNFIQYPAKPRLDFISKLYFNVQKQVKHFISIPKIATVVKNVGTCAVNGAMELVSYYMPAPFIPLIATVAGMILPFEPVVTLKEKMPVTSYRKAFQRAMNTFLGTFDKYKIGFDEDDDPYMTRRFNRRFMNIDSKEKKIE